MGLTVGRLKKGMVPKPLGGAFIRLKVEENNGLEKGQREKTLLPHKRATGYSRAGSGIISVIKYIAWDSACSAKSGFPNHLPKHHSLGVA